MKISINGKVVNIPGPGQSIFNAPIGAILAWSGTENDIPEGWSICNGENGTLDLRDKFILGAGDSHDVGETGGSEEVTLTVLQIPKHNHSAVRNSGTQMFQTTVDSSVGKSGNTGTHITLTGDSGNSQPHPNMPPYYSLLFIQKISISQTDYMTVEASDDRYLQKSGGTVTGSLNVPTPTANSQVANKQYVDEQSKEVYSVEETVIGTWIDGKPLYRRVFPIITVSNSWSFIDTAIENLDGCFNIYGVINGLPSVAKTRSIFVPNPHANVGLSIDGKPGIFVSISEYANRRAHLITEYTKTTDQPTINAEFMHFSSIISEAPGTDGRGDLNDFS